MPGFDLGQIQNVVDQRQQIVVGRENRLRILHLLGAERAVPVVGQQLGQDQRAVERGAQFVRHIGQKFGLVTRGGGELVAVAHQLVLRNQQGLLLRFQCLGAFFQLHVGLFQLGLLLFQIALRLLQAAALLFQLFVGHAQLFLLGLQFFALALGFFQQGHQLRAQQRGAQGQADVLAAACQQFLLARTGSARVGHAAKFDDADHTAIGSDRWQQQFLATALAQAGGDLQMSCVHAAHAAHRATLQGVAQLPGVGRQCPGHVGRKRGATGQTQALAFDAIQRAHLRIQRVAQCANGSIGQCFRALVTAQTRFDRVLCLLQPQREFGLTPRADRLRHHQRHRQERHATDAAVDRGKTGIGAGRRQIETHCQQHA